MINTLTKHAMTRMLQRSISKDDINLIMLIGTEVEGGYYVLDKDCQAVVRALKGLVDQVLRLSGKRVVVADGQVVTAYHARPSKERSLLRRAELRALKSH